MKLLSKYIMLIALFFFTQTLFAQEEIEAPEPPEPDVQVDHWEFNHFLEMSEKDEKELLKNLKKDLREDLQIIKKINKEKYIDFLRESQYKHMRLPFFTKHEKVSHERERKIFEAEIKAEALAAKYATAKQSQKRSIRDQLKVELSQLFVQKEERRKEEVEILQKELVELQKSLEVRQKNKNQIIERRIQELLEEDEYLDWD